MVQTRTSVPMAIFLIVNSQLLYYIWGLQTDYEPLKVFIVPYKMRLHRELREKNPPIIDLSFFDSQQKRPPNIEL